MGPPDESLMPNRNIADNKAMRRRVLSYGLLALAATAAAGGLAVHRLLDRPGESAFAFIPANAKGVASFDLVPAPDQVLAFKNIDSMISQASDGKSADPAALIGSMLPDPALKPLTDQIDRSVAFAWLPPQTGTKEGFEDVDGVAFVALKDAAAFERVLRAKGKPDKFGGTSFYWLAPKKMGDLKPAIMVHGGYAMVTDKPWILDKVGRVIRGEDKPITDVPAFAAARERALSSSNLLVLVSPEVAKGDDWGVASMAIRDGGMEFAVSGQSNDETVRKAGSLVPLGSDVLAGLPRGAYGFFAMAQPGPAVALAGEALDEPTKSMKEEMEMDLKTDVLPALAGNFAVAFYPSFGPDAGLDLLVSMDDANGADPATLARKLERFLEEKIEEGKPSGDEWRVKIAADGADASRLADEPTDEIRDGIRGMEKSFFRPLTLSRNKTIAWAMVGRSVLFATSQSLLERAVAARRAPSAAVGLSGDAALGARPETAADGQFALAISMKRLAEGIRNTVDPSHMSPASATTYRKTLSLYDNVTEPLAIRAQMSADGHFRSYVSIPFDWSKLPGFFK